MAYQALTKLLIKLGCQGNVCERSQSQDMELAWVLSTHLDYELSCTFFVL